MQNHPAKPIPGEPLRYFVTSRSGHMDHLVDLSEWNGNGKCGCKDFTYRMEPLLRRDSKVRVECWHIRQAKHRFCEDMIRAVLDAQQAKAQEQEEAVEAF